MATFHKNKNNPFLTSDIRRQRWLAALLSSRWSDCAGRGRCCSDCAAGSLQSCRSPYCGSSGSSWAFWSRMPITKNHKDSHQNQSTETNQKCEHWSASMTLSPENLSCKESLKIQHGQTPMGYWMIEQICLVYNFWPVGGTRNVHDVLRAMWRWYTEKPRVNKQKLCQGHFLFGVFASKTVKAFLENKIQ